MIRVEFGERSPTAVQGELAADDGEVGGGRVAVSW